MCRLAEPAARGWYFRSTDAATPDHAPGGVPRDFFAFDFKKAWRTARARARLPVGRNNEGYVFHRTRNTAARLLRATGNMGVDDVMRVGGWKTAHVVRHYDLGNVEALHERLGRVRRKVATDTRLRDHQRQRVSRHESLGPCTAPTQQEVASGTMTR